MVAFIHVRIYLGHVGKAGVTTSPLPSPSASTALSKGPGDLRLALGGCEMVFSGEDAGWQVWFDGDSAGHGTEVVVSQIAQQVQEFTGEHIEWIRYD